MMSFDDRNTLDFQNYIDNLSKGNIHERAVSIAMMYGQNDSAHHLRWVIDQMVRVLSGDDYDRLIEYYNTDDYKWDAGIAP